MNDWSITCWRHRQQMQCRGKKTKEEAEDEDDMLPQQIVRDDGLPPVPPPEERVMPRKITDDDVEVKFVRSSGPGGQSVNKTNSKADVRFNVYAASWLPNWVRERLVALQQKKINTDGELVVQSDRHRSQHDNLEDCMRKLQSYIDDAAYVPNQEADEQKKKKLKKKVKKANEKRLESKKQHSEKKKMRKAKIED